MNDSTSDWPSANPRLFLSMTAASVLPKIDFGQFVLHRVQMSSFQAIHILGQAEPFLGHLFYSFWILRCQILRFRAVLREVVQLPAAELGRDQLPGALPKGAVCPEVEI